MRSRKWIYGKKVLISGVSSGMGADLARQLISKYNCSVFGIARSIPKLEKLAAELPKDKFTYISMDISSEENWANIAKQLTDMDFMPDIVINNAGIIQPFIKLIELEEKDVMRVIQTNYMSIVYSMRTMIPILKKSKCPAIVNIASASAYLPVAGASIYSSTKSAVLSLTEVSRAELMGEGFYVGAVMPGPVKTDLYKARAGEDATKKKVKDSVFDSFGLSSAKAAKRIIRNMKKCNSRISIDGIGRMMDWVYRAMPRVSVKMTAKFLRVAPLQTYKDLFKSEKEEKAAKKAAKKAKK